jgi:predicted CXXCH cytochrome family protein
MSNDPWKITGLIATAIIALAIPASLLLSPTSGNEQVNKATFAGGKNCIECHQQAYQLWKGSNHDNAMDVASDSTVLGDFNNAEFSFDGKKHRFYRRDGKFYVYTEGKRGEMKEFQITHTFGVRPLQQYLIPFEMGKFQCLPIAWDTIKKRWFHMAAMVYDKTSRSPNNWLYWTNQAQNWNGMCAECHSTNLQKNFDPVSKSFATTWSDIDVNCEACHGPGSRHIEWAKLPEMARSYDTNMDLVVKTSSISSKQLVGLCAPCHSRRSSLGVFDHDQSDLLGNAVPGLPSTPTYFVDGQIRDEDYEYGSFTQSKMYMRDVRCTDCHNAHSAKLKFEGNALCGQCHKAAEYDTYAHHYHKQKGEPGQPVVRKNGEKIEVGEGARCITCHMAGRYYMGIHYRHDHSFRIPRPDLSITLGTPNACNDCHEDKSMQWSVQQINKWYGQKRKPHYGTHFADAAALKEGTDTSLAQLIGNDLYPEIVRATAIEYLAAYQDTTIPGVLRKSLHDPDPLIRYSALRHYNANDPGNLLAAVVPALNDPVKAVRLEAANKLSILKKEQFIESQLRSLQSAQREYEAAMLYVADFPTGRFNLGRYYETTGDVRRALENYEESIAIDSLFYPAKVNLAFLFYNSGNLERAEALFIDLAEHHPEYPDANYNLGLLYGEQGRNEEAIARLEAAAVAQANSSVYYNLALMYQHVGEFGKAESTLLKAGEKDPGNFKLLYALCDFYIKRGNKMEAEECITELRKRFPNDEDVRKLSSAFFSGKTH